VNLQRLAHKVNVLKDWLRNPEIRNKKRKVGAHLKGLGQSHDDVLGIIGETVKEAGVQDNRLGARTGGGKQQKLLT